MGNIFKNKNKVIYYYKEIIRYYLFIKQNIYFTSLLDENHLTNLSTLKYIKVRLVILKIFNV